jgi:hypothetical protein
MKKLILMICAGAFLSVFVNANNADLFSYDENQVTQDLSQLQALENYVSANPDISLVGLQAENNSLLANLNLATNNFGGFGLSGEPPLGIPSFLWGCVFTLVGVAIVYFITDQDMAETKKAFLGCVVSGACYILWWVFWVLVYGGSFWYY